MGFLARIDRHAELFQSMAETVGIDLGEAVLRGKVAEDLRGAVLRCVACDGAAACPDWMAAHADGSDEPPDYCRNRLFLAGLRD